MDRVKISITNGKDAVKREPLGYLQWVPNWLEFSLVIGLTLWPFVFSSVSALLAASSGVPVSQSYLESLLALEIVSLVLVAPLMHGRGWTSLGLGLQFELDDIVAGILLVVVAYTGYVALWVLFSTMMPDAASVAVNVKWATSSLGMEELFAAAFVNAFFEELFVAGYLIQCMRSRFGVVAAVNASILVRLLCHVYQGPISVLGMIPIGLFFAWSYVRTGRLWPLVLGHALLDFITLFRLMN